MKISEPLELGMSYLEKAGEDAHKVWRKMSVENFRVIYPLPLPRGSETEYTRLLSEVEDDVTGILGLAWWLSA